MVAVRVRLGRLLKWVAFGVSSLVIIGVITRGRFFEWVTRGANLPGDRWWKVRRDG